MRVGRSSGPLLATLIPLALAAAWAHAGRADYVGSEACATCHPDAYAIWQNTAHARAGQSIRTALGDAGAPSPVCQTCHTTGEAPAGPAFFANVGCEACHGPGAGYGHDDIMRNPTLAGLLGLRDLSTPALQGALCAECHRVRTRLSPFDPKKAYRRIAHK